MEGSVRERRNEDGTISLIMYSTTVELVLQQAVLEFDWLFDAQIRLGQARTIDP